MARSPAPWLALLALLPDGVMPRRTPVAAPGTAGAAPDSPIAGWESLVLDLSDMPFGIRVLSVTLDAHGTPIAASDHVMRRDVDAAGQPRTAPPRMRQESVGGRIEADGSVHGTHWIIEGSEVDGDEPPPDWQRTSRAPTADETRRLLALVRDVVARC
jgi:hypothetical protein